MNLSRLFIERPVATLMLVLALALFGALAYRMPPVNDLPQVDFPTLRISASLPGANPETMGNTVATPLERQLATVAGIESMSSQSSQGSTNITLQFELGRDIDAAAQDVQTAIAQAARNLPQGMDPPQLRKINPADSPILYLALSAERLPLTELDAIADSRVAQRLSGLSGVAQVLVFGSQKYALRLYLDPARLQQRGLTFADVIAAVQGANANLPSGTLDGATRAYTVKAPVALANAADFGDIVVAYRDGAALRVKDPAARSTAWKTTRRAPGTTAPAPSCWRCSASRGRTRSRSPTASARCCRRSRPSCRTACACRCISTARASSRTRCTRSTSPWSSRWRW